MSELNQNDQFTIPVRRIKTMPVSFPSNFPLSQNLISLPIYPKPKATSINLKNYLPETIKHLFEKINETKTPQTNYELPKFSEEYKKIEEQNSTKKEIEYTNLSIDQQKSKKIFEECTLEKLRDSKRKKIMKQSLSINEIISIVCKWRTLCYPEKVRRGEKVITKEEAARTVNIKKKSLDDYLMFIRLGITMGFDFKTNGEKTFNFLRKFIKSMTNRIHWNKNYHSDVEALLENIPN